MCGTTIPMRLLLLMLATGLGAVAADPRFIETTRYLNHAKAVATHTFDDSNLRVIDTLDALDKYGVKATAFVNTSGQTVTKLWPRLKQAITNGHEVGSHSRRHQCEWPDTEAVCRKFYDESEVAGSRDDIVQNTGQKHVWSFCYPCGNCSNYPFTWDIIKRAGYLAARNYPGEQQNLHNLPDLQTWAENPYNAAYTQVVQKQGGIAKSGRTDPKELNAKFDEVYRKGGIYHFVSHPAWLEFGADAFYEQHLKHLAHRADVWYVPFGPLYAYRQLAASVKVTPLGKGKFDIKSDLDLNVYNGAVTLAFEISNSIRQVRIGKEPMVERPAGATDRWDEQYFRREGTALYVTVRPDVTIEIR